jgi:hypothetical protein
MRNTVILLSCVAVLAAVACEESKPRRNPQQTGTAGTTGQAGTTGSAGTSAAAGTTGSAGTGSDVAGTTGTAGTGSDAAGTTGTAGTGSDAAGTTGTAGTGAAGTGAAGTGGPTACTNSTVVSAGGSEANCGAKSGWTATAMPTPNSGLFGIPDNKLLPPYLIDGSTGTRYSSGATMADGFYVQIDLGAAKMVSGIVVDVAADVTDVANGYEVSLSTDGTTFNKVAGCTVNAAPIETINFAATNARYIRYTAKGGPGLNNGPTSWLSIAEISVVCN